MPRAKVNERTGKFYCTEQEWEQLQARRIRSGLSLSRYLVESGLSDGRVASPEDREQRARLLFELRAVGKNLNQLAARVNSGQSVTQEALLRCLRLVEATVQELRSSYGKENVHEQFRRAYRV